MIIGDTAFMGCHVLEIVVISENVLYIGDSAFRATPRLTIYCKVAKDSEQAAGWHPHWDWYANPPIWAGEW